MTSKNTQPTRRQALKLFGAGSFMLPLGGSLGAALLDAMQRKGQPPR